MLSQFYLLLYERPKSAIYRLNYYSQNLWVEILMFLNGYGTKYVVSNCTNFSYR